MSDEYFGDDQEPREHRAGAWLLLIIGVTAMGLGIYQWKSSIANAFERGPSTYRSLEQQEQERLNELKTKDTDNDGLNDFEESYVFKTSPYLNDSDSDGINDKEELENGTNPNCPEGKECGPLGTFETELPKTDDSFSEDQDSQELEIIQQMLNPSPAQIRTLLLQSGVSAEELEKLDDELLIQLYRESLQEADVEKILPSL